MRWRAEWTQLEARPLVPDGVDSSVLALLRQWQRTGFTPGEAVGVCQGDLYFFGVWTKSTSISGTLSANKAEHRHGVIICTIKLKKHAFDSKTGYFEPVFNNLFNCFANLFHFSSVEQALRSYLLTWGVCVCVCVCVCLMVDASLYWVWVHCEHQDELLCPGPPGCKSLETEPQARSRTAMLPPMCCCCRHLRDDLLWSPSTWLQPLCVGFFF